MSARVRLAASAAAMVALLTALSGCGATDTYRRPGVWHPDGANAANIAAMAENPGDLAHGRAQPGSSGRLAAQAIDRLWEPKSSAAGAKATTGATGAGGSGGTGSGASAFATPLPTGTSTGGP